MNDQAQYLTTNELAQRFNVSRKQIERYVPGVQLGRKRLYRLEDALAALRPAPLAPIRPQKAQQ
jgi:hypothetical protein